MTEDPEWTDHDVSDPGITLLQAVVFGLAGLAGVVAWRKVSALCHACTTGRCATDAGAAPHG